jgi:hypothetical protein
LRPARFAARATDSASSRFSAIGFLEIDVLSPAQRLRGRDRAGPPVAVASK